MKQADTFSLWSISSTGGTNKTWRIYEGKTMPLLARFLTVKDNYLGEVEYNGTATGDVGTHYNPSTQTSKQAQTDGIAYGIDWVSDVTRVTPKELEVSFAPVSKDYDGTTDATPGAATLAGVVAGDDVALDRTNLAATYADGEVGTGKTVTYTGLALKGSQAQNYILKTATVTGLGSIVAQNTPTDPTPGGGDSGNTGGNSGGNTGSTTPANPTTPTDTTPTTPSSDSGNTGSTTPTNPTTPTEPTPTTPSGGNGGNTGNTGGNTGSTTPTPSTTPITPTPTTPNSGGNTSGTGANTPTPLAAAEPVIVAAVTETETIAAAATAGVTAEMTHIADNVRPTNIAEQPMNSGENAAAAPLAAAADAQGFTLMAGGLLAISNETNSAPKDAMSVESIGHALSTLQHGSGEKSAATAPNTETKSAAGSIGGMEEAVEATDLAIGTEIAETDRESKAEQENLASDTGTAGGADESAEESDEKKKR